MFGVNAIMLIMNTHIRQVNSALSLMSSQFMFSNLQIYDPVYLNLGGHEVFRLRHIDTPEIASTL